MSVVDHSYVGVGNIYMKDLSSPDLGLIPIGNCSKLNLAVDVETKKQNDYTSRGGGVLARLDRINSVGVNISILNISVENIARAIGASISSLEAGTVSETPEEVTAVLDTLVRLAHPNPTNVVVKDSTGTTTYVAGVDYTVSAGGITPLSAGDIVAGSTLKVTYSYGAYKALQALMNIAKNYALALDGMNDVDGIPVVIDIWKVRFGPGKEIAWIGNDWAEIVIEGEALKDPTKGSGESGYYRVQVPVSA